MPQVVVVPLTGVLSATATTFIIPGVIIVLFFSVNDYLISKM
jgi:hypothetical protein